MTNNKQYTGVTVENKSAVVIGGTSGIGRGIVRAFANDGANVIATSRSQEAVDEITAELQTEDTETTAVTCDITDRNSIEELRDVAIDTFGQIDILVNSVSTTANTSILEMTDSQWDKSMDVFLKGTFRSCQIFAQAMDSGSIINISSMSADQIRECRPAYCAAKSGVNGLTRAASADLAPEIRVNAISPGFVRTRATEERLSDGSSIREPIDDRTPMNRVANPQEIAGAAIYLASDAASFTTGEIVTVDGGYDRSAL
ncbi:SDR family NAD(P)-dependent oxidoreductase [Haladaptatus pallidirubidus]|uniref:SDR family NAD(P)-dependent oxidoreductase n=1 Tax=Haladaptatus pallidirubidus TaxID=1008152 RepID=UPI001D106110|nr:SDR family oxidoreductase [Haladaptatus pallidirubidus]